MATKHDYSGRRDLVDGKRQLLAPLRYTKAPKICRFCKVAGTEALRTIKILVTMYEHDQGLVPCAKYAESDSGLLLPPVPKLEDGE